MVGGAQAAIRDSTLHARVLVIVKKSKPQRERNGAALKPKASTLSYALDTAVVVIDGMTDRSRGHRVGEIGTSRVKLKPGLAHSYASFKGGNDEVGGHWWKIGTQAALVPAFAKPAKVGPPPDVATAGPSTPQIIALR